MEWEDFRSFANDLGDKFKYTGGVDDGVITSFEESMKAVFPLDYKNYLKDYGSCRVKGCSFLGIGVGYFNTSKECYDDFLSLGLPKNYLPLQNYGEFLYCLKIVDDKYSIIYWSPEGGSKEINNSLASFIRDEISEALEL